MSNEKNLQEHQELIEWYEVELLKKNMIIEEQQKLIELYKTQFKNKEPLEPRMIPSIFFYNRGVRE